MANPEHLAILNQGFEVWNKWREENRSIVPDLSNADLRHIMLSYMDLSRADLNRSDLRETTFIRTSLKVQICESVLNGATLTLVDLGEAILSGAKLDKASLIGVGFGKADLSGASLREANLSSSNFHKANLYGANLIATNLEEAMLIGADLREAILSGANLTGSNLREANLTEAGLNGATLVGAILEKAYLIEANLTNTDLSSARIYGISAWNVNLAGATQSNLVITPYNEPEITVDNLEIAQFVYLLLHNAKIRDVIDTIGKKAVLILGRFSEERKAVLDAIRDELRLRDYIPILFDFEKPSSRDLTETISTLAHLSRFIIADITDAKSIPQELQAIVPNLPSVTVQPIILAGQYEYAMFEHFKRYPWVLPVHSYQDADELIAALPEKVINPAEAKANEIRPKG